MFCSKAAAKCIINFTKPKEYNYLFIYLVSGSHNSRVSNVESSVSVDVAECGCFGVVGKLVRSKRRHVHRRSEYKINKQTNTRNTLKKEL